ncbi:MAG: helix-turn-helix domain-containing protein [Deltaproteobacteria bacterium]|nr:helix-turn-helix domain-containing protein [Deltaproteobacteria bacterium]
MRGDDLPREEFTLSQDDRRSSSIERNMETSNIAPTQASGAVDQRPAPDDEDGVVMLTAIGAARLLGLSSRQVYRLVEERRIPHVRFGLRGGIRFERGVLAEWLRAEMLKGIEDGSSKTGASLGRRLHGPRPAGRPESIPAVAWP